MADAGGDRGEHRRLERKQCVVREEPGAVLAEPDRAVGDVETSGDVAGGDRFADQVVGLAGVRGRVAGNDGCRGSQVCPSHRGESAIAKRRLQAGGYPRQQRSEELGVEPVAQDRPPETTGLDQVLSGAVGEREREVVPGAGQAGVDHVRDAVADRGVEKSPVTSDDLVVLGIPGRDQHQCRDTGEVQAGGIVEVQVALPFGGRSTATQGGHLVAGQLLEREGAELPVRAGHHDHCGSISYRGSLQ